MKYLILSMVGLLTSGCAAVLVASTAVVLTEEFQDNAVKMTVEQDAEMVWARAKSSLAHMADSNSMVHTDEDLKHAVTTVRGAEVSVAVQNWNTGETRVRVMAKKFMVYRNELAQEVCDTIAEDLHHEPSH